MTKTQMEMTEGEGVVYRDEKLEDRRLVTSTKLEQYFCSYQSITHCCKGIQGSIKTLHCSVTLAAANRAASLWPFHSLELCYENLCMEPLQCFSSTEPCPVGYMGNHGLPIKQLHKMIKADKMQIKMFAR